MSILLHVDQHAACRTLRDDTFVGNKIRVLNSHRARDDLTEGAQLVVSVDRLDRYIDVDSRGA